MEVSIRNLGQYGVIQDTPAHNIPVNAWSDARGVRFYDNAVWKAFGEEAILGTPTVDPYYVYNFLGESASLWAYPGLAKVYATDGTTHSNITRSVGGDYTGNADDLWQGTFLGGVIIFNNGKDDPQQWTPPALGTVLVDLVNWPASTTARVMKSFKQYLFALDVTKSGVRFPQLIKWSHVADPGTVPTSWDETDPTVDAGEYPLSQSGGFILDAMPLGDVMMIYKEDATWVGTLIGGRFIFDFKKRFATGLVNARSVVNYKGKHYVATPEDVIVHDGFQQESLLDDKMRRWYRGQADPQFSKRQFMVLNTVENEIWHCIPGAGQEHPNVALVINFKDGTQTLRDLDNPTFINIGPFDPNAGATTFDSQTIPFDQMQGVFGQRTTKPGTNRPVGAHRLGTARFLLYDETFTREGANFRGYVERQSMPIAGADQRGAPILHAGNVKLLTELWPEIRIQNGTHVDIYVGCQMTLNEPITWYGPFPFEVGVDDKIEPEAEYRYLSVRFETSDASQWKLDSYTLNVEDLGRYG